MQQLRATSCRPTIDRSGFARAAFGAMLLWIRRVVAGRIDRKASARSRATMSPPGSSRPAPRRTRRIGAGRGEESAGCESCHTKLPMPMTMHRLARGPSRLHRLPWRRCERARRCRARPTPGGRSANIDEAREQRPRPAALSARVELSVSSANPQRGYALLNREAPEYRALRQSRPITASRATACGCLPPAHHPGGGTLDHGDRRDAVGRRVSYNNGIRSVQEATSSAKATPATAMPACIGAPMPAVDPGKPLPRAHRARRSQDADHRRSQEGRAVGIVPAADAGRSIPPGDNLPRVRAWRAYHRHASSPRSATA